MTAAVLQGVPVVTADVDLWIGMRQSRHDEVLLICHRLGATIRNDYFVELPDGALLNFTYHLAGLNAFSVERNRARTLRWLGKAVSVLSLEQLRRSKQSAGRPKDKVHLNYIEQALALRRRKR